MPPGRTYCAASLRSGPFPGPKRPGPRFRGAGSGRRGGGSGGAGPGGERAALGEERAAGKISVLSTPSSVVDFLPGEPAGFIPGMRFTCRDLARGEGRGGGGTPRGYVMDGPPMSQVSSLEDCPTLPGEHLSKQRGPLFPKRTFPCRVKEQDLEKERRLRYSVCDRDLDSAGQPFPFTAREAEAPVLVKSVVSWS